MQESPDLRPRAVLLIDDDPDDRALVARELGRALSGIPIVDVADETSFERALGDLDAVVVATDRAMGWADGLAAFRRIHGHAPFLLVVMFTGTWDEEIAVEGLKVGIDDYVLSLKNHADPDLPVRMVHPLDRHVMEAILRDEEPPSARRRWVRKDGRVIWTDSRIRVVRDRGRPSVIEGITRHVMELALAEQDLEEHGRKLGRPSPARPARGAPGPPPPPDPRRTARAGPDRGDARPRHSLRAPVTTMSARGMGTTIRLEAPFR